MTRRSYTDQLAEFVLSTRYEYLPHETIASSKRIILDTTGCALAGLATESGRYLAQLKTTQGGAPESTLFASGTRLPCAATSYVHSQAANALDADECLLNRTHFACCVVPPVLAFCEKLGSSGREAIAAVALGFDIAARVSLAMPFYEVADTNEVRATQIQGYSASVFGVAAALGRLHGLSPDQMRHAFGIAYASVPAQRPHWLAHTAMTKYAMFAAIAEAGANAAVLAGMGFTADPATLDPHREFWRGFGADSCDYESMTRDLGQRWLIDETSFKLYPVARPVNIVVDLFTQIFRQQGLAMADIEEVVVRAPPSRLTREFAEKSQPATTAEAAFSAAHAIAMVAAGIPAGPQWALPEHLHNPSFRSFMQRMHAEARPEWQQTVVDQVQSGGTYLRVPTEVVVKAGGRTFTAYGEAPRGDPGNPLTTASDDELRAKFKEFAAGRIDAKAIERAICEIGCLEQAPDVRVLMAALA